MLNPVQRRLVSRSLSVTKPQTSSLTTTVFSVRICDVSHLYIMLQIRSAFRVFVAHILALAGSKYFATSFLGFRHPDFNRYLTIVLHMISFHQERCPWVLLILSEVALVANALPQAGQGPLQVAKGADHTCALRNGLCESVTACNQYLG